MKQRTALIVGAGIGGLAAAIALRAAGWQVRVFERSASPRELGFGLNLAPNAIAALGELGLAAPLISAGHVVRSIEFRRADGRVLKRLDAGAAMSGTPAVFALRPVLYGALLDAVGPAALDLGRQAVSFVSTGSRLSLSFDDGGTETGEVLIGADGIGSAIRRTLHPHEPPPRASGCYGLRGVADGVTHLPGDLSAVAYVGGGMEAATIRAGKHAVYWYISGREHEVPMERGPQAIARHCAARLDLPFRRIVEATPAEGMRFDRLHDRDPLDNWGRGPVTLLGDAAHPMLPQTGQGAAQALEDAVALGLALRSGDAMASLRRYEQVRARRTRPLVRRGRTLARFMTASGGPIDWLRAAAIRVMPAGPIVRAFLLAQPGADPHRELRG